MANWLHRVTKEYMGSNDPPLDQQAAWIKNPDLSAVAGETVDAWIVDGDTVRLPTEQEWGPIRAARLEAAQQAKLATIDAKTGDIIEAGSVTVNGESISTRHSNQTSLLGMNALYQMGLLTFPRDVSATNGLAYTIVDYNDFKRVSGLVSAFVDDVKSAGRLLRAQVLAAGAVEEVDAVTDNRE